MNTSVTITVDDLLAVELTGNKYPDQPVWQACRGRGTNDYDQILTYLTAEDAMRVADHFHDLHHAIVARDKAATQTALELEDV